eukprot:SAG25_NODE_499_length_7388_cov_11.651393_11_plen_86_part_01
MCVQSGTKGGGAKGRPSFVMQPEVVPEDHEITFASPDYMPGQLPSPGILKKLESRIAAQVSPPPPPPPPPPHPSTLSSRPPHPPRA